MTKEDKDKKTNSQIKIQYFKDYWNDLTDENRSIENELVHTILYNPKELLKEFIEEIERKNLSNNDNRKFFIDKINEFSKMEINAIDFIKPTLKLIQQQFSKKDDYSYLLHLLKMAVLKLDDFILAKEAIKELTKELTNESSINIIKIKHLVNLTIFELMHKKYLFKAINKVIHEIFSSHYTISDGTIHSDFPHTIECLNWEKESSEFIQYQKDLKEYIEQLTIKDRISALNNYFEKDAEELRFIFQLKGIKGDNLNINIGNVQIYNPLTTKLFKNPSEYFNEFFRQKFEHGIYYCNASVLLPIIDYAYAKDEAITILQNTLNLIASRYTDYKIPIEINKLQYYVIDKEGNERGSGSGTDLDFMKFKNSIELDNDKYDSDIYSKSISKEKALDIDKKILESMHWKRKAIETNELNEKLLWHWVTLENIFERENYKTPKTIFETVPKILTKNSIYNFAWKHFNLIQHLILNKQINLSEETKNKIGFNTKPGEDIYLKSFIDNIEEIKKNLTKDSLIHKQLDYLTKIFEDKKVCLELSEKLEKIFFEKLVYVYRLRNKIVHNAYNEKNPITPYYVEFLTLVSSISINTFIKRRANFSLEDANEIVNNINFEFDEFKLELKEKGTEILFK